MLILDFTSFKIILLHFNTCNDDFFFLLPINSQNIEILTVASLLLRSSLLLWMALAVCSGGGLGMLTVAAL